MSSGLETRPTNGDAATSEPIVSVRDLSVEYTEGRPVVRAVQLTVHSGECFGIAGESGSGKSTLALAIAGLLPRRARIAAGSATVLGIPVTSLSRSERRGQLAGRIGSVFQNPATALNPSFRIGSQLRDAIRYQNRELSRADAARRVGEQLELVALDPAWSSAYPHELSGGMQQRVVIAMALAGQPRLLIADEPTSQLDATVQTEILELFVDLRRRFGLTLIVISHDLDVLAFLADRAAVMRNGQVLEVAPIEQLVRAPQNDYVRQLIELSARTREPSGRYLEFETAPPPAANDDAPLRR
jgi:ABC-type glutathione transport system ATPase component